MKYEAEMAELRELLSREFLGSLSDEQFNTFHRVMQIIKEMTSVAVVDAGERTDQLLELDKKIKERLEGRA